jgi:hypothetical protein
MPFPASMWAQFVALLAAFRSTIRSRLELEAEILALRHQLAVLQRPAPKRPRLGRTERLLWVVLSRLWPNWRRAIQIVTPDTVVRWHRRGFYLSQRCNRALSQCAQRSNLTATLIRAAETQQCRPQASTGASITGSSGSSSARCLALVATVGRHYWDGRRRNPTANSRG